MAMSDCVKCWNTPCTCGYEYRNWTKEARERLAAVVLGVDLVQLRNVICAPEDHPQKEASNAAHERQTKEERSDD